MNIWRFLAELKEVKLTWSIRGPGSIRSTAALAEPLIGVAARYKPNLIKETISEQQAVNIQSVEIAVEILEMRYRTALAISTACYHRRRRPIFIALRTSILRACKIVEDERIPFGF